MELFSTLFRNLINILETKAKGMQRKAANLCICFFPRRFNRMHIDQETFGSSIRGWQEPLTCPRPKRTCRTERLPAGPQDIWTALCRIYGVYIYIYVRRMSQDDLYFSISALWIVHWSVHFFVLFMWRSKHKKQEWNVVPFPRFWIPWRQLISHDGSFTSNTHHTFQTWTLSRACLGIHPARVRAKSFLMSGNAWQERVALELYLAHFQSWFNVSPTQMWSMSWSELSVLNQR